MSAMAPTLGFTEALKVPVVNPVAVPVEGADLLWIRGCQG